MDLVPRFANEVTSTVGCLEFAWVAATSYKASDRRYKEEAQDMFLANAPGLPGPSTLEATTVAKYRR